MHRTITFVATLCAAAIVPAIARSAHAQETHTIVCESMNGRRRQCSVPAGHHVWLAQQLGTASCRTNVTWGMEYGYVWVDRGCRARFAYRSTSDGRVGGGHGGGSVGGGYGGGYEDDRGAYGTYGGGYGGVSGTRRGTSHPPRHAQNHAEEACMERAYGARLRVDDFGRWSHLHGNLYSVDMSVQGRWGRRRVRCVYDRRHGQATLDWCP
ncbi:MAG TPA: DUF3011 domain-containing protein [Gemmatimonadaceae bacterium]